MDADEVARRAFDGRLRESHATQALHDLLALVGKAVAVDGDRREPASLDLLHGLVERHLTEVLLPLFARPALHRSEREPQVLAVEIGPKVVVRGHARGRCLGKLHDRQLKHHRTVWQGRLHLGDKSAISLHLAGDQGREFWLRGSWHLVPEDEQAGRNRRGRRADPQGFGIDAKGSGLLQGREPLGGVDEPRSPESRCCSGSQCGRA